MSVGNGKADDGASLVAPITVVYQLRAQLEGLSGKLADAERRAESAEKRLRDLRSSCEVVLKRKKRDPKAVALAHKLALLAEIDCLRVPR